MYIFLRQEKEFWETILHKVLGKMSFREKTEEILANLLKFKYKLFSCKKVMDHFVEISRENLIIISCNSDK